MQGPIGVTLAAVVGACVVVAVVALFRRFCCKPGTTYTAVNHGLDEEEMAFKKSMEQQHGDDIDELFNFSGHEELDFDTNDLDNFEMLERRGKPSAAGRVETGLGKDENGGSPGTLGARIGGDGVVPNARVILENPAQEAEDLEALLEGGYRESGKGPEDEESVPGSEKRAPEKGFGAENGANGRP